MTQAQTKAAVAAGAMPDAGANNRGLPLAVTLSRALRSMPGMARGAGPVLALATLMVSAVAMVPGTVAPIIGSVALIAVLSAYGAVTRIGLYGVEGARVEGLRPGGFQVRRLELRLMGAGLLNLLFMSIILSLLALTALALFGAAGLDAAAIKAGDWGRVGPAWKLALLVGVGLVVLATPLILMVRLSLHAQATAAWGRMISLSATGLTNGAMLPLFIGLALCSLPGLIWALLCVTGAIAGPAVAIVGAVMIFFIQMPLTAGFLGAAWRRLGREQG